MSICLKVFLFIEVQSFILIRHWKNKNRHCSIMECRFLFVFFCQTGYEWMAKNTGVVKSETYSKNGKLFTWSELTKLSAKAISSHLIKQKEQRVKILNPLFFVLSRLSLFIC